MSGPTCGEDGGACGACKCGGLIEADPRNFEAPPHESAADIYDDFRQRRDQSAERHTREDGSRR